VVDESLPWGHTIELGHALTNHKKGGYYNKSTGKFLTIFEKQGDGSWKIAIDCFNFDALPG
jgi:ketosteroid isomerase-like protein